MSTYARWLTMLVLMLAIPLAQGGTKHYYYTDAQGTVLAKADAQGNIVATYDYAPYGAQALGTPPSGPTGYTGHVSDAESGFVYMQARYYDPGVGRFLGVDPKDVGVGNLFKFNRFSYANNNPVNMIDVNGEDSSWVQKGKRTNIVIPVNFVGSGATKENIKTIISMARNLDILNRNYTISIVSTDKPINGQLNTMDLSAGYDDKYEEAGEGVNRRGGNDGHINTSNRNWLRAALHDVLHFASFKDGYKTSEKGDKRTIIGYLSGYDGDNIMAERKGNVITSGEIDDADDWGRRQNSNKVCHIEGPQNTMHCE